MCNYALAGIEKTRVKKVMKKPQLNVRTCPKIKEAVGQVADRLDWTRDDVAEVAFMTLFGSQDGLIREKRRKIVEAAKELALSFSDGDCQPDALAA